MSTMRAGQHDQLTMGGRRQPRTRRAIQPGQDVHGIYQAACVEFAAEFGWSPGVICWWWSQLALAREASGEPRAVAEFMAMRNVRDVFDCRGRQSD